MSGGVTAAVENPHAGKGSSVLLDIGGDVGALVLAMPAELEGAEIELRPAGRTPLSAGDPGAAVLAGHRHDHHHHQDGHDHGHDHHHGHDHGPEHGVPHVAVVPRPSPDGTTVYSAVFFEVPEGRYELSVRPGGPVRLTVEVAGGRVTDAEWPR